MTDTYWPSHGGMEESIRAMMDGLRERFSFTVYTHCKHAGGSLLQRTLLLRGFKEYKDPSGVSVHSLVPRLLRRSLLLPFVFWYAPLIRRLIPNTFFDSLYPFYAGAFGPAVVKAIEKADLVHCFSTNHLAALATSVCQKAGKPIVQSPYIHFGQWGDTPGLIKAYLSASLMICPTESSRQKLLSRGLGGCSTIITNPPLPPVLSGKSRPPVKYIDPPFILFLGRNEAHKNLALLAKAYKRLPQGSARLVVAGPGHDSALPHTDCIELGMVDEPTKQWLLSKCDIFCVPSTSESFGMVFTEAMAYAKPVVAIDIAPVNEIVKSGETGILVRSRDPVALANALRRLLDKPRERRQMGAAGYRRYRERYSRERVLQTLGGWYEKLTG